MNRELLFRGKRIDNGEWIEGGYCYCDNKSYITISVQYIPDTRDWDEADYYEKHPVYKPKFIEVIPNTVGQYTGLTDKNGKKIFEGDIVHYLYELDIGYWNSDQNSVIEWRSTGFYMNGIFGTNKYACLNGWLVGIPHGDGKCFEVIGNIHDNPELLKGDKNDKA